MAISSYPSPADAGVICIILANTAISISIVKSIVRSLLHIVGIHVPSWDEMENGNGDVTFSRKSPSDSYMDDFRTQTPSVRYDSISISEQECSICLAEFESNSEIHQLACGHVFHCSCLEKWLKYWNKTCPLCRNYMMPQDEIEDEDDSCPM